MAWLVGILRNLTKCFCEACLRLDLRWSSSACYHLVSKFGHRMIESNYWGRWLSYGLQTLCPQNQALHHCTQSLPFWNLDIGRSVLKFWYLQYPLRRNEPQQQASSLTNRLPHKFQPPFSSSYVLQSLNSTHLEPHQHQQLAFLP